ncbi:MAG: hypothetical protein ACO1NZ_16615 [Adhaeribacter sp.]
MEPEEIDKLFRDKLAGRPALPSPEAWMRLQQQMEPKKKEKTMWIYYAAASVVLLMMAGLLYFRSGQPGAGPAIATAPASKAPAPAPEKPATEQLQLANTRPAPQQALPEVVSGRQQEAQPAVARVSGGSKPKSPRTRTRTRPVEAPVQLAVSEQQEQKSQDQPSLALAATPGSQPAQASAEPDLSIVEVKVQRNPEVDQEPGLRDNLNRKGQLLKNIYKQARNLKNGEPVELASLGVNEGRIQEETKELKQKISNVISL